MIQVQTVEDVYPALDELAVALDTAGQPRLATLRHRMHQVAWTTRGELFEELRDVLIDALQSNGGGIPGELTEQMGRVLSVIRGFLAARH